MSISAQKRELRKQVVARRDELSPEELRRRSEQIARRVMRLEAYAKARTRLLFASFGSEVRTDLLLQDTLESEARLILPRCQPGRHDLALHEVHSLESDLAPGTWGIPEPLPVRCSTVELSEVDFILVPGVAFDRHGGRLGYGGGFYDRMLRARRDLAECGATVAVTFSMQIVDAVPRDEQDVVIPIVVTEDEVIVTSA